MIVRGRKQRALLLQLDVTLLLGDLVEGVDSLVGGCAPITDFLSLVIARVAQVLGVEAYAGAEGARRLQLLLRLRDAPSAGALGARLPGAACPVALVEVNKLALHSQLAVGPVGLQVPLKAQLDIRRLLFLCFSSELDEAPALLGVLGSITALAASRGLA